MINFIVLLVFITIGFLLCTRPQVPKWISHNLILPGVLILLTIIFSSKLNTTVMLSIVGLCAGVYAHIIMDMKMQKVQEKKDE
jgi:hypothetical protein